MSGATAVTEAQTGGPDGPGAVTDGRRLRRDRNRLAVVDALLDLYADGNLRPSSAEIAERAGLSPRSLFRYFDDVDDLCRAAIDRQLSRALPLVPLGVADTAPLAERVEAVVAQRVRLFAAIAPAATVSRLEAPFQPVLAAELASGRAVLRAQLSHVFRPELSRFADGGGALSALDVLCSFESYHLLRHDQGLSDDEVAAVLRAAIAALVARAAAPR
jgi:AcrR family transcriptional regulator